MRIIKISAMWCPACLIMNNVFNKIEKEMPLDLIELDYDIDEEEVQKYNVGNTLPVIIFMDNDKEIKRIAGEYKKEEILDIMKEL